MSISNAPRAATPRLHQPLPSAPAGRSADAKRPALSTLPFDVALPPGGYAWWYFDAESDCGQYGICIIGFVGSVFSPHYARAQRRGLADPWAHTALNVVLYGRRRGWVFSEQPGHGALTNATTFRLRANAMRRTADGYIIDIDERRTPGRSRITGRVTFTTGIAGGTPMFLDAAKRHQWCPVAPLCRVAVELETPALRWQGRAYHDANWGTAPLAQGFAAWSWLRALHPDGTLVHYAPVAPAGTRGRVPWATLYGFDGQTRPVALPAAQPLPRSRWGLRPMCHGAATVLEQLEDTPFYTRARLALQWEGCTVVAMHEHLDLQRWQSPWVQFLLPFRLRRHRRWDA